MTKTAEHDSYAGNVLHIIEALKGNGFKLAKAYPSQCYSLYKGKAKYKKTVVTSSGKRQNVTKEENVDWEAKWEEVAIYLHGYYGWNIAWAMDGG